MMLKQRKEAIKEIIEADTDDMKEVLCLGATFAPTQQFTIYGSGEKCQSLFLQKFWTCLGVQYFALLIKLPQAD